MGTFSRIFCFVIPAIFGEKKYLRPGIDDDVLLQLLEADSSDVEGFEDGEENDEFEENVAENEENNVMDLDEDQEEDMDTLEEDQEENIEMLEEEAEETSRDGVRNEELDWESDDDLPLSVYKAKLAGKNGKKKSKKSNYTWKNCEAFSGTHFDIPVNTDNCDERQNFSVSDYFAMYFDDNIFQQICYSTNVKYMLLHQKPLHLTVKETKHFFGISILMSLLKYPRIRMYWAKTTKVYAIASKMTRDRFFVIRNHLKVVIDGDISEEYRQKDKLWKIRPIMKKVRDTCLTLPREAEVAIDEQMIPFTGVCGVKQFVRGKPNPEGLKNFVCATPSGLILDFELYQGKNTFLDNSVNHLGVGGSAVIRLVQTLPQGSHVYIQVLYHNSSSINPIREKNPWNWYNHEIKNSAGWSPDKRKYFQTTGQGFI